MERGVIAFISSPSSYALPGPIYLSPLSFGGIDRGKCSVIGGDIGKCSVLRARGMSGFPRGGAVNGREDAWLISLWESEKGMEG